MILVPGERADHRFNQTPAFALGREPDGPGGNGTDQIRPEYEFLKSAQIGAGKPLYEILVREK